MGIKEKKAWCVAAYYPNRFITMVINADTLHKAFKKFRKHWDMEDVQEISITEVISDERSEGVSGADSEGR